MLAYGEQESLPVEILRDETTGFPLLSEADGILQLILAYLELPYSVTEHGCGKKASLIIDYLLKLGIPAHGLARGMILEADMSPEAMVETDFRKRPHALVASNPLNSLCDLDDQRLVSLLMETCRRVDAAEGIIQTGPYILRHDSEVQFVQARSHIYPILWFWDPDSRKARRLVIDPSLDRSQLLHPGRMRELLNAREALMFQAPLLGYFRLETFALTEKQQSFLNSRFSQGATELSESEVHQIVESLSQDEHASLIREMTGAQESSLGDPATWTYANNLQGWDRSRDSEQDRNTGRADAIRNLRRKLIKSREERQGDAPDLRAQIREAVDHAEVHRVCAEDAAWSARALAPLADVTMTAVYFSSLLKLDAALERQANLPEYIIDPQHLHQMRGLGVRLRRRVDWLADASMNSDGEIDARALSEPYFDAAFETIRQMNSAGLFVAIDSAGNIHGLYLLDEEAYRIRKSGELGDLLRESIHHISHIDSVKNAGRFDGRLGVTGGIEVAHILRDLEKFCQRKVLAPDSESSVRTHVSALLGEEMTFTGEGVSMPGSSALTGQASVESIYKMKNHEGQLFKDRFLVFLRWLAARQESGQVVLLNQFSVGGSDEELLESCFKPGGFFTRHTFERHIEQGPILDRHSVPMTLVSGIMGIHQEDFHFRGENAEAAALDINRMLRELNLQSEFTEARITVGITRGESDYICHEDTLAMRWTLDGELNHAGATDVYDRKDPGVALARLAQEFYRLVDQRKAKQDSLKPLAGNVRFNPGINRNVIPGSASITLAVRGSLSRDDADSLAQELQGFTIGTLAKRVSAGGEGIRLSRMESMSYINVHDGAMVSIDLRTATEELTNRIRKEIDSLISKLQKEFSVRAQSLVQQQVKPFRLKKSGQVLLMERSYGGSHNPNEAELQTDLTRGTILQFQVVYELLQKKNLPSGFNLYSFTEERIPEVYRKNLSEFISGALHDTCNIAASAAEPIRTGN